MGGAAETGPQAASQGEELIPDPLMDKSLSEMTACAK